MCTFPSQSKTVKTGQTEPVCRYTRRRLAEGIPRYQRGKAQRTTLKFQNASPIYFPALEDAGEMIFINSWIASETCFSS